MHKKYIIFVMLWFIINVLQSMFLGLHFDEAYYWVYSTKIDWGYFDHPPMVALLIKMGYALFHNELGVRLFHIIVSSFTLLIILFFLSKENQKTWFTILFILSFLLVHTHISGFLAIPDTPLIFFSALFFLLYQKYLLHNYNYKFGVLMAITIACMIYSKYHAFLIITFTFLSNLKLIKQKSFWLIVLTVLILILPHLCWQYLNRFPSFKYHIAERSAFLQLKNLTNYLYSQILVIGLFHGPLILYLSFVYKPTHDFEKALKFNVIGFYSFFLVACLKGWVEAHWTAAAFIPMLILSFKQIAKNQTLKKYYVWLALPTFLLILFMRSIAFYEPVAAKIPFFKDFFGWHAAAKEINQISDGKTVYFIGSYRLASLNSFYSGKLTPSLSDEYYRYSQYDIWKYEKNIQNEEIFLIGSYLNQPQGIFSSDRIKGLGYSVFQHFTSYSGLKPTLPVKKIVAIPGDTIFIEIKIHNESMNTLFPTEDTLMSPIVKCYISDNYNSIQKIGNLLSTPILPDESKTVYYSLKAPEKTGNYTIEFVILYGNDFRGQRTGKAKLLVNTK